jgi:integrase
MAFLPDSKTGKKIHYLPPAALHILSALPKIAGNPYVFPGAQGRPARAVGDLAHNGWDASTAHSRSAPFLRLAAGGSGTPLLVIGKLLGHRHVTTTARYAHLADDSLRVASVRRQSVGQCLLAAVWQRRGPASARQLLAAAAMRSWACERSQIPRQVLEISW